MREWTKGCSVLAMLSLSIPSFAFKTADGDFHAGVVQLSAGVSHTCALMADFHVSCWGSSAAALGLLPTPVPNLNNAIQVASGNNFACALLLDHSVSCWGDNSFGQLGDGTHSARPNDPRPVKQGALVFSNVKSIAVGDSHVCAVKGDSEGNTVWCWGSNTAGQLGNYTVPHLDFRQPIQVVIRDDVHGDKSLSAVELIGAGVAHTCASFIGTGKLACWGSNDVRQIGNEEAIAAIVDSPVAVKTRDHTGSLVDFVGSGRLAVGADHSCVATARSSGGFDDSLACWGNNDYLQLANNSIDPFSVGPTRVVYWTGAELTGATTVSLGYKFSCIRQFDASTGARARAECWGWGDFAQLGPESYVAPAYPPREVAVNYDFDPLQDVQSMSAGHLHTCALLTLGRVRCWGMNGHGQLGLGSMDGGFHYLPDAANVDAPLFFDNFDAN